MKKLSVIAPPGRICPKQGGKPAGVITDSEAVSVPDNAYYRRLLAEGSLLKARPQRKPAEQPAKKGGDKS